MSHLTSPIDEAKRIIRRRIGILSQFIQLQETRRPQILNDLKDVNIELFTEILANDKLILSLLELKE